MSNIEELIKYKRKIEQVIENLEGAEIKYKDYYGTLMYVRLDGTARIYLEDEFGESWEEDVTWSELANSM